MRYGIRMPTQRVDPLEAEVRSIESGLRAYWNPATGSFRVRSSSRPGLVWSVTVGAVKTGGRWLLKLSCDCESGTARPGDLVPCLHGACVARSLERRRLATWTGGVWCPAPELMGRVG